MASAVGLESLFEIKSLTAGFESYQRSGPSFSFEELDLASSIAGESTAIDMTLESLAILTSRNVSIEGFDAKEFFKGVWDNIKKFFKWIRDQFKKFIDWIKSLFAGKPKPETIKKMEDAGIKIHITEKAEKLQETLVSKEDEKFLVEAFKNTENVKTYTDELMKIINEDRSLPEMQQQVKDVIQKMRDGVDTINGNFETVDESNKTKELVITKSLVDRALVDAKKVQDTLSMIDNYNDKNQKVLGEILQKMNELIVKADPKDATELSRLAGRLASKAKAIQKAHIGDISTLPCFKIIEKCIAFETAEKPSDGQYDDEQFSNVMKAERRISL